jgi:hypothetical protein
MLFVTYSVQFIQQVPYNKALKGFGDFKIGKQVICTVQVADELVLLTEEEMVLQGMTDRLTETGRRYGMEMNLENPRC